MILQTTTAQDNFINDDEKWIECALSAALEASRRGEVPVGAVLVRDKEIIGEGGNSPINKHDPTAHAEIIAIRNAATTLKNYRLPGTTLYVTLEPCIMCMGAILHARIERLVYGASDPKSGAASSVYTIGSDGLLNHNLKITGNILEQKCASLLKNFFKDRRNVQKNWRKDAI